MAQLEKTEWVEDTLMGKQFHLYARQRQILTAQLSRYSKMAIDVGLAERAVRLAEQYGTMLARLISGILGDLELTPAQADRAPAIVRKHLIAVQEGSVAAGPELLHMTGGVNGEGTAAERRSLPALEAKAIRRE
jgi:hypothetical protein